MNDNNNAKTFANEFLKIYDRLIASGAITFSSTGLRKEEFTNLCMNPDFTLEQDRFILISEKMGLDEETFGRLKTLAGY